MVRFINLTPHPIHLVGDTGAVVTFAESGMVARVETLREKKNITVEIAEGIYLQMGITEIERAEVYGLPEPQEGIIYLVSSYVAQTVRRADVLSPDTGDTALKDANGRILGVKGFINFKDAENKEELDNQEPDFSSSETI